MSEFHSGRRFIVIERDWKRFDRRYAVFDTKRNVWCLQTNDITRALEFRDALASQHD